MKRTFKLFAALLAAFVLAAVLCACTGAAKSPAGLYKIKTIDGMSVTDYFNKSLESEGMSAQDYLDLLKMLGFTGGLDEFMTIELKDEGSTALFTVAGEEPDTGTWELDGTKLTITVDGESETLEYKDGLITMKQDEATYVFERVGAK